MGPLDLLAPEPAPLFGGPPPRNAYVELHNLIAAAESAADFGPADRDRISERWGVDLATSFPAERVALYRALLDARLADGALGGADRATLAHLADTLGLSAADLRPAHERAFGLAVEAAIADDRLDVGERLLLYTLQHALLPDPDLADEAYGVYARRRFVTAVATALADGEVSPEEAEAVEAVRVGLSVEATDDVQTLLDEAAALWRARHAPLPDEGGAGGEAVHFRRADVVWRRVDGARLAAASGRHRAALETGETANLRVPESACVGRTEVGTVTVTSRRTVLSAVSGVRQEAPHYALADVFEFANGAVVRTVGGRSTFLDLGADRGRFAAVARRLRRPAPPPAPPADAAPPRFHTPSAVWESVDPAALRSVPGMSRAMAAGETADRRVRGVALDGRPERGGVAVTDADLVLTTGEGSRALPLDDMAPPLRYLDGVLVRPARGGPVLVDVGDRGGALHAALRRGARADRRAAASGVRWRRVLAQEVHAVRARRPRDTRPFWQRLWSPAAPPDPRETVRALDARDDAWDGLGEAAVTGTHLVFRGDRTRRTSLPTVSDVVADGCLLWVLRPRAHDWLVRFETSADAERVRSAVLRGRERP